MRRGPADLPEQQQRSMREAKRLAWWALAFQFSAVVAVYLVMGSSQAMKAAWIEDTLGLVPPVAFLIAARYRHRPPEERFPWGFERAPTVAFLVSSVALALLGLYLLYDSVTKLLKFEHTTIGTAVPFGHQVWAGWVMMAVMAYTIVPAVLLGRRITKVAADIEDKSFHAEGAMLKADWMTAAGTIVGLIGVGFGIWWFDAGVACLIALDIIHDGWTYLRGSVGDVMDKAPTKIDESGLDDITQRVEDHLRDIDWVADVRLRLREEGHVVSGEAFVVPRDAYDDLPQRLLEAEQSCYDVSWRVHDVVVTAVPEIEAAEVPTRN